MTSITKMLATVLFGVAIAGTPILAQTVTIDYDHSVNFLKFRPIRGTASMRPTPALRAASPSRWTVT